MADRSVTVRLRVNTTAFSTGMTRAQRDAANLTRRLDQTGASAERMRRRLEAATRALPAIKIDADASGAERKVDELRRELVSLSGRRIGIDVSTAQALGEIQRVERELEQLALTSPDVQVQADVATAMAELAAVRREIAQIDGATPTVRARVDASDAVRTLEDLRARMDALASRRIGVDVDARAARAEIEDIQRQLNILSRTTADPRVRVEVDRALADLRRVDVELSRLDARVVRPRVDVDVSGALLGIAAVSAALSSLPIAATIGVAAAAFSSAAAGAAGFAAVAVPSLNRINEALKQQETAANSAGGATQSLAAKQAQAAATALQLAEAQDRVRDAQERVREAKQRLADTVQDVAYRQEMANRRVEDAERALAEAHRATQRALEDLNRAREEARERLEDLALATERGALSEERARLNILRAQQELARVMSDPKATSLDIQEAQLRLKEAQLTLKEVQERNADLAKEYAEAQRKGIEGSDQVTAAKERLRQATQRELDAERALQDARREAARVAVEGQRAIAKAQAEVLRAQREAERAAQRLRVQQLQAQAAMEKAGGAAGRAANKMQELSKEERELAEQIKNLQERWEEWQRSLQPEVFPVISQGIQVLLTLLPKISPLVRTASGSFMDLMVDAEKALRSPAFAEFLADLEKNMPAAIEGLGKVAGNTFVGIGGFIQGLLPHTEAFSKAMQEATQRFADWGKGLKADPEFQQFIADMVAAFPKVAELLGKISQVMGNLAKAGAALAPGALNLLIQITDKLASLSPQQLQQLAVGIGAFIAALKLGTTIKLGGLMLLVEVISRMSPDDIRAVALAITALVVAVKGFQTVRGVVDFFTNLRGAIAGAGTAAHTAAGRFAGLRGVLVGGGIAAAVAGIAVAAGNLDRVVSGLSPDIDNLAKGLTEFAKGGKPTKEVLDTMVGNVSILRTIPGIPVLNDMRDLREVVAQMASDNIWERAATGIGNFLNKIGEPLGVTLDHGAKRLQNMDQALAQMVRSGNADQAAKLFNAVTEWARKAGVPLDRLRALFPQYTAAVAASVKPTQDAAGAFGSARSELDKLNSSMSGFTQRTDYARFIQDMKASYDSLTQALKQTGGNLDITRAKTDAQREAVIQARQRFEEYIQKVQELGNRQKELTGSTENARQAVLNQIGVLLTLAGRSKEARERVYALAQSFGITREEANKAKGKVDDVKRSLDKLQNKTIKVSADTSAAERAIQTLINKYKGYKVITQIDPKTGRFYTTMVPAAEGMILRFANGGAVRPFANGSERHVAQIARPGTIRIWAEPETGGEAYIPLARSKRPRSLQILRAVADQFGYLVVPKPPEDRATVPATTPGGGQVGTVTVDLNNLDNVTLAVGYTARVVTKAMKEAAETTAGATDDLTSTIDESNTTLVGVSSTLQEAIDRLSAAIDNLAAQVAGLSSAAYDMSSAVVAVGGSTSGAVKSSSSSATTKPGLIAPAPPAGSGGLIPGSQPTKTTITIGSNAVAVIPTFARGGLVTGPALVGEAGPEMVVPLSPGMRSRGVQTLQEAAARLGYTVMPSYMVGGGGGGLSRELRELRAAVDRLAARAGLGGGVNVHVTNHYPQAEPTSVTVNRGLQYAANLGMLG